MFTTNLQKYQQQRHYSPFLQQFNDKGLLPDVNAKAGVFHRVKNKLVDQYQSYASNAWINFWVNLFPNMEADKPLSFAS